MSPRLRIIKQWISNPRCGVTYNLPGYLKGEFGFSTFILRYQVKSFSISYSQPSAKMTTATFKYIDPASYDPHATEPFKKPWGKVDGPGRSYNLTDRERKVENLRGQESEFTTDNSGFAVYNAPAKERLFTDDEAVKVGYYAEVEELLRKQLRGVKKVTIFDHTIRRRLPGSARSPVQLVHVDQTPAAAEKRVRRHLPEDEVEELLKGRYQIINVWRPIENPATDFPLAVVDWRSTKPDDFVKVDLLYPKEWAQGREVAPDPESASSTDGYEVKGETFAIAPNEGRKEQKRAFNEFFTASKSCLTR